MVKYGKLSLLPLLTCSPVEANNCHSSTIILDCLREQLIPNVMKAASYKQNDSLISYKGRMDKSYVIQSCWQKGTNPDQIQCRSDKVK